ncbi:MAG: hypothetical protein WBX15_13950 [Thermoanaerobaculia bacterium]
MSRCCNDILRKCRLCGTVFEAGVADPSPTGEPRCPQCGLWESDEVESSGREETVIRHETKFR